MPSEEKQGGQEEERRESTRAGEGLKGRRQMCGAELGLTAALVQEDRNELSSVTETWTASSSTFNPEKHRDVLLPDLPTTVLQETI